MNKDLYKILNIPKDATLEEIKVAFKNKVKKTHPDLVQGKEDEFLEIVTAYQVLSNEELRKKYDNTGTYDINSLDIEALAKELIFVLFNNILILNEYQILLTTDILLIMKKFIISEINNNNINIKKNKRDIIFLNKIKEKIKKKNNDNDENNLFKNIIIKKIKEKEEEKKMIEQRNNINKKSLEILDEYYYVNLFLENKNENT